MFSTRRSFLLFLALALLLSMAAPANAQEATNALQAVIGNVLNILRSDAYADAAKKGAEAQKIRQEINTIFDFEEFSLRAVGRPWGTFTDKQKKDFQDAFADLMSATYMDRIQAYTDEKVEYTGELKDPRGNVEAQTQVVTKDKNIPINYRMKEKNGKWIVYDIIVEGVSLVMNYRSQFKEILLKGTPDDLIARVRTKVEEKKKE